MFTWKQESAALRLMISHAPAQRVKALSEDTGLSTKKAQALLDEMAAKPDDRHTRARGFYSVALSMGQDMAGLTLGLQAFMAAGLAWFGLFLAYDGRTFLSVVSFGLMFMMFGAFYSAYRQYQAFEAHDGVVEGRIGAAAAPAKPGHRKAA